MKEPKVYFFDLDGTSYYHKYHDVMPSTLDAWRKLKEKGYKVAIATSRCLKEIENLRKEIREFPFDAVITDGGALIQNKSDVLLELPISKDSMKIITTFCDQHDLIFRYSTINGDYFTKEIDIEVKAVYFKLYLMVPEIKPYEESDKVFNVLLYLPNEELFCELKSMLPECAFVNHQVLYETTNHQANKFTAIKWLAEYWNIDLEEVMAFGDGFNDVEMLKGVGYGVAMGNGQQECKDVSKFVCDRIEKGGIAKILKELKLID